MRLVSDHLRGHARGTACGGSKGSPNAAIDSAFSEAECSTAALGNTAVVLALDKAHLADIKGASPDQALRDAKKAVAEAQAEARTNGSTPRASLRKIGPNWSKSSES